MKNLFIIIIVLGLTTFIYPEPPPVKEKELEIELHFVMNDKFTIIHSLPIKPDSFINLTGAIPYYKKMYITVKTGSLELGDQ